MSLLDTLRLGVRIADSVTKSVQATVTYYRYTGEDGYGAKTYASAVKLNAIVDFTSKQVRTSTGILTVTRATITLLDVDAVKKATSSQGIGNDDKFVLPDGDTGPVLDLSGFVDAGTTHPLATEVMLG